ncbi:Metallophosphoesterase OS=Tsukamurella paurometabola (strain ATCC 8368 / DSM / CCUG 35730 /CIP 100753 / JCM 10117 / KCTC 9821 / NBRC 16120 / NCIMB 702349/ NCTC 13040) OX=521096 GN=Tpau_1725 PE=4 SV=1 [Tsukamurella paurometabola]|uniref:Metallophosphoesterase n=1 Tax=Tsukamurella paurometabola (strain ATCC 8368 / DSM 20162 / CCUG 35730 / CIP 100753 / JCM 10117 / KCTC 9821 / NBRC 16120 / NCIMB 702349 / NCTC 13040) TaxID=521096 RepID=D5UM63_TSUPD|nr:metallophosphoesterase [Tsukamurella paurometabola]ADG78343.1 metallophosphoesterase [Tsukamurella paurometabola DSM 20162]SUP31282.1 putative phosphoesterase [Tsukamurella paurometabola]
MAKLFAISDLHVGHRGNEEIVDRIRPETPDDWLILAGDICERTDALDEVLAAVAPRFATVIWVPGNHELYTTAKDPMQVFGAARYDHLVDLCRSHGVLTPEDPYPVFDDPASGPVTIAAMFLLYDYTFRDPDKTKTQALAAARENNVVATDEFLLSPEPYATRDAWCAARLEYTRRRLAALPAGSRTVLINHWPLRREPTEVLFYPDFALWCGTVESADWHLRYRAEAVVYGHLHIPRTIWYDGVRFEEVSVGYPREWKQRGLPEPLLRQILPAPEYTEESLGEYGVHFTVDPAEAAKARQRAVNMRDAARARVAQRRAAREARKVEE